MIITTLTTIPEKTCHPLDVVVYKFYDYDERVNRELATQAEALGADAIIDMHIIRHQERFSLALGTAVRLVEQPSLAKLEDIYEDRA